MLEFFFEFLADVFIGKQVPIKSNFSPVLLRSARRILLLLRSIWGEALCAKEQSQSASTCVHYVRGEATLR